MPDLAEMNETEDLFDLNTRDNSYQTESNINSWWSGKVLMFSTKFAS